MVHLLLIFFLTIKMPVLSFWKRGISHSHKTSIQKTKFSNKHFTNDLTERSFLQVGEGTPSKIVSARTAGAPPLIDHRLSPLGSNATWISVGLTGWRDGGCPITHFGVAYRVQGETTWVIGRTNLKEKLLQKFSPLSSYLQN